MMITVNLYSTLGCHLCDQAKAILLPLLTDYQFQLIEIDIANDDELVERFGIRIPVLTSPLSKHELNWPFNSEKVNAFFTELLLS